MKKVAVIQSNYLPWKGYFDIINDVDTFIFYDDVQYTKNDWRNRNKLKSSTGTIWITVPTGANLSRLICEVEVQNNGWQRKHWKMIENLYSRAPYFKQYRDFFQDFYLGNTWQNLSQLNQTLIIKIARDFLGISTRFEDSRDYSLQGRQVERLLDLLQKVDADIYISGPSAKAYIKNEERFLESKMTLQYKDYTGYPEYTQLYPPFSHEVSILDVLFNCGPHAQSYIWGWREKSKSRYISSRYSAFTSGLV